MFESGFERKIKRFAAEKRMELVLVNDKSAKLIVEVNGHRQPVYVIPFGEWWELSCPSVFAVDDVEKFPQSILTAVLKDNATNKRGFWCIERVGDKEVLEYMHNVLESTLGADEFYQICYTLAAQVERIEEAFRKAVGRAIGLL